MAEAHHKIWKQLYHLGVLDYKANGYYFKVARSFMASFSRWGHTERFLLHEIVY